MAKLYLMQETSTGFPNGITHRRPLAIATSLAEAVQMCDHYGRECQALGMKVESGWGSDGAPWCRSDNLRVLNLLAAIPLPSVPEFYAKGE